MRKAPKLSTGRLGRGLGRLGLIVAGVVAGGALLELGVRLFDPHVREHALPHALVPADDLLGWRLAPSAVARHRGEYFDTDYVINTLGYRDGPRSPSALAPYRLLLFGDSQVFGWGLPADQRFSNLLEAGDLGLEVWNLGVPGYGLDQQVLSYQRDAAAWRADAVVFFVSHFTEDRLTATYVSGYYKPFFRLTADQTLELNRPTGGRLPRSLLFELPRWMYTPYFVDRLLARADHRLRPGRITSSGSSSALLAAVLRLGARLGQERRQSVFVVSTRLSEEESTLRRLCAALEIRYLALGLPAEQASLFFGPYDAHWNADANQQIAASLGRQLAATIGSPAASAAPPHSGPR